MLNSAAACRPRTCTRTLWSAMSGSCRSIGSSTAYQGLRKDGSCRGLLDLRRDFQSRWVKAIPCRPGHCARLGYATGMPPLPAAPPPTCRISWDRYTSTTLELPQARHILTRVHLPELYAV